MRIDFYQLGAVPLERVLPAICEKLLAGGGRLLVVAAEGQAAEIDRQLWTYAPESFLPHGRAGEPGEAGQPVLVSQAPVAANGARNIAFADGVWRDEGLGFDRVFHFFDAATLDAARTSWRALGKVEGAERHFWKQDDRGRWSEVG